MDKAAPKLVVDIAVLEVSKNGSEPWASHAHSGGHCPATAHIQQHDHHHWHNHYNRNLPLLRRR